MPRLIAPHRSTLLALLACWPVLAGCSDRAEGGRQLRVTCRPPGDSELSVALDHYLGSVSPRPRRFLVWTGTEHDLPEAGRAILQRRGPTFLYPDDSAAQARVTQVLTRNGSDPALLLSYHGMATFDVRAVVHLSGRFVGGENHGREVPRRAAYVGCGDARWRFLRSEVEMVT